MAHESLSADSATRPLTSERFDCRADRLRLANQKPRQVNHVRAQIAERTRSEVAHLNEMSGPVFKAADDPRLTRVGRFLRTLSLDELLPRMEAKGKAGIVIL